MNLARNIFVTLLARILLLGLAVASSVVVVVEPRPGGPRICCSGASFFLNSREASVF